jgi:hypothetical protein
MLNRNDRVALRRNRAAVSWLCFLLFVLTIWIVNLYKDKNFIKNESEVILFQMSDYQNTIISKNKTIDSLNKLIVLQTQVKKDTVVKTQARDQSPKLSTKKPKIINSQIFIIF